ncbi:unnamed protein product [Cylindrotheca closterium]|uniref:Thioredoxin domain-containing protein n=1 Tax=Cylindrotheca closterium TaxID=2856 RepID=A0AAD2CK15_9STRA|nr:unnamed protein product [Cylindrotheca closterium]
MRSLFHAIVIIYCTISVADAWRNVHHQSTNNQLQFGLQPSSVLLSIRGGDIIQAATLEQIDTILEENTKKLVVIDFTSKDCPPCKKVAPLYEELSESEEFSDKVVFLKVDVDENTDAVSKYGVTGWPTFLFIKRGEVQAEVVGGKLAEATLYDWVKLLVPKEEAEQE